MIRSRFVVASLVGLSLAAPAFAQQAADPARPAPAVDASASPSAAQTVSPAAAFLPVGPDGARALEKAIDGAIGDLLKTLPDKGGFEWRDGSPKIDPAVDHYEVTLPPLLIHFSDGAAARMEGATYKAVPRDDGSLEVAGAPAGTVTFFQNEAVVGVLTFGKRDLRVVWFPAASSVPVSELKLGEIRFIASGSKASVSIESLTGGRSLTAGADGRLSGPGSAVATNLVVNDDKGEERIRVASLGLEATVDRLDPARGRSSGATLDMTKYAVGLKTAVSASGLRFVDDDKRDLTMGSARLAFDGADLDKPFVSARLDLATRDIKGAMVETVKTAVPSVVELSVGAERLPMEILGELLNDPNTTGPKGDEAVLIALRTAGTSVKISGGRVETPLAAGALEGAGTFKPGTPLGFEGAAVAVLRGIDDLIASVRPKPGQKADKEAKDLMGVLSMIKMFGQAGKDDQGRETRSYKFEVTRDGQVLLNGSDMSAIAGMGDEAPAPAAKGAPSGSKAKNAAPADDDEDGEEEAPPPPPKKTEGVSKSGN